MAYKYNTIIHACISIWHELPHKLFSIQSNNCMSSKKDYSLQFVEFHSQMLCILFCHKQSHLVNIMNTGSYWLQSMWMNLQPTQWWLKRHTTCLLPGSPILSEESLETRVLMHWNKTFRVPTKLQTLTYSVSWNNSMLHSNRWSRQAPTVSPLQVLPEQSRELIASLSL